MAATKLQMNWASVALNVNNNNTTITRIDSVSFNSGGELIDYMGDVDKFPTVIVNNRNRPSATVRSSDPAAVMALIAGATYTAFYATHKDAKGGSSGDISYVMANAVIEAPSADGSHAAFGSATFTVRGTSSDGATNPLSFTRTGS
jgi:hypothetical protein